ncbi:unnamed protein product [Notodromas monacha]|uniref:Uncharacterized protein n=1 Tax=Notodromas monacha TaxID=399045 RepID=A0A7R9GEV3_9CRUS|nr:unnamed protein product [Notodromas monacha]CAG0920036.1 unnamed protein product [Notodromas monacha]
MDSCVDVTMNSDAPAQKSDAGSENENLGLLKASAINADDANSAPEEKPRLSAVIRPVRKSLWTPQESILPISKTSAFTNSPRQSARKKTKKVFDDSVPVKISQSRGSNPTLVPVPSSPLHWDESRFNADVTIDEVELNPTAKMSTPLLHGSEVTEESLEYQIGDLVWASVNSFPYWPAIVCQEYATNTHYQVKAQGMYSKLLFHVMFLNDKNRHNWVSAGKIEPFVDEKTFEEWKTAKLNAAPKGRSKRFWMKLFTISPTIRRAYKVAVEIGERLMPRPRALRCQELLVPNSVDEKTFDSFVAEPEPFPEPEVKLKDESSRSSTKEPRSLFPKFEKRKEKLCAKCFKFIPEPDENLDIKVAEQGIECSGGCGKSYHRLCYMNINATKNQLSAQFRRSKKKSDVKSEVDAKLLTMKTATCPECESDLKQCFICKALDKGLQQCVHKNCRKHYHNSCVGHSKWHQSVVQNGKLTCPLHKCHTCASLGENAKALDRPHKLIQCVLCPTAYHYDIECSPAGTYYIGGNYMICPKVHGKKLTHANCSVCLLCSKGGMLICCDACPSAVHAACLPYEFDTEASFLCEFCEFGKMPLYRDIVWAKIAHFRFWPAIIVDPEEIPLNVLRLPYEPGQFPVMFFGTHQYSWVDRTRVFWYEEDDWKFALNSVGKGKGQTKDQQFKDAINEAKLAYDSRLEADKIQLEEAVAKPRTKPPPYVKIKGNKPFGRVKAVDFNVSNCQTCNCDPSSEDPCGPTSNCLNRHVLYECHASLCPAGEKCRNQCFQRREYPQLAPFPTGEKGWGLKSLELIKKGSFVIEYVGELIDNAEYETRMAWKHKTMDKHYYFLTLDSNRIIDAGPKGNLARFMNHSCEPNCVTQKWSVAGDDRVGLFALRDIQPGEELTFNYNLESVCKSQMKVCECKAPGCVGHIGMKVAVKPDEEEIVNEPPKKKRRLTKTGSLRKPLSGCYYCGKILDELIPCKTCPRTYHEECVKRNGGQLPRDNNWLCPWHFCAEPDCKTVVFTNRGPNGSLAVCDHCPTSYCIAHKDPKKMTWLGRLGYVCHRHSKVSIEKLVNFLTPEYVFADCMNATPIAKKSKVDIANIPDSGKFRIGGLLLKHHLKLGYLFYFVGLGWMISLCYAPFNAGTYFSENALLPGLVDPTFREEQYARQTLDRLRDASKHCSQESMLLSNGCHSFSDALASEFRSLGIDVHFQAFNYSCPLMNQMKSGLNVYGILRAPRHASTESIVLSTSYNSNPVTAAPGNLPTLGLMIALAKRFKKATYWAKDIIFLAADGGEIGTQAWLEGYHEVSCGKPGCLIAESLSGHAGAIQAAINLEFPALPLNFVDVRVEGLNGQLPNLDLVTMVHKLCSKEGIKHTHRKTVGPHNSASYAGFITSFKTLSAMMTKGLGLGLPSGNHGLFLRFAIPAVTLRGHTSRKSNSIASYTELGRAIEGMTRCLNNLLERFHQSFFFYLLPAAHRYISIGLYFGPFALMALPLIIRALAIWLALPATVYYEEIGEEERKEESQETETGNNGDSGAGDAPVVAHNEPPAFELIEESEGGSKVDYSVLGCVKTALACHAFGLGLALSPEILVDLGKHVGYSPAEAVLWGFISLCVLMISSPMMFSGHSSGAKSSRYMMVFIGILEVALVLFTLALYNIATSFILGEMVVEVDCAAVESVNVANDDVCIGPDIQLLIENRESEKAKNRKSKKKEEKLKNLEYQTTVAAAKKLEDPLEKFAAFKTFASKEVAANINCVWYEHLDNDTRDWVFDLTRRNMMDLYNDSHWGWNQKEKEQDMFHPDARYIIARDANQKPIGFVNFRFDMDYGLPVFYLYEIQLECGYHRFGLGRRLMAISELVAFSAKMMKVVLTVLDKNEAACKFFNALGYTLDESSPTGFDDVGYGLGVFDYKILSKINKRLPVETAEEGK